MDEPWTPPHQHPPHQPPTHQPPTHQPPPPGPEPGSTGPEHLTAARPAGPRAAPVRLRVGSSGELLGLVPYLLGFHPQESLVLLLVRDHRVLLSARVDLPPPSAAATVLQQFVRLREQHGATGLVVFAFSDRSGPARAVLRALIGGLGPDGLLDAVHVGPDRYWSLSCSDGCCPADGIAYDLSSHPLAAEAVYAGLTAAARRDDVEALVAGPARRRAAALGTLSRQQVEALQDLPVGERAALMASEVRAALGTGRTLGDRECVRLAVLAGDVPVRDVAWTMMDRPQIESHVDLWQRVVSRTVEPWAVAPLCLLALAAWIAGNGALQNCCSERARRLDPACSLVGLLEEINLRALSPSCWDLVAAELRDGLGSSSAQDPRR